MSDVMQSVKLENAVSWTDTLKTATGFRFFARHSEFIFGVIIGSAMTASGFKFRHQFR
jgi:hypothetical protein